MTNRLAARFEALTRRWIYDGLLLQYGIERHQRLLKAADRSQSHTYTRFLRSPGQIEALCGPVMDYLDCKTLIINVFACSKGMEAYTVASTLLRRFPDLDFKILASDLHPEVVEVAEQGYYSPEEVGAGTVGEVFLADTFRREGGGYRIKPEVRTRVQFAVASLLDAASMERHHKLGDIAFLQNVLCHLDPGAARQAFSNSLAFLKPKAALFLDGAELDLRTTLTLEAALEPLDFKCREIHELARRHIGGRWWNYYYGMPPYSGPLASRLRRFSTIFLKGKAA